MEMPRVWVFFYGSYMNREVVREIGITWGEWEVAKVHGFDIAIRPRANLLRSDRHCVYGVLATTTHEELTRLYAHSREVLGETYLPEAVTAETADGKTRPALCYIAPAMQPRPAASDYLDRIVAPARGLGFPAWYIERLESFRA